MYTTVLHHGDRSFTAWSSRPLAAPGTFSRLILMMHGFPDNRDTFLAMMPIVQREDPDALLVAPALRGYEVSSQQGFDYSVSALALDVRLWILELVPNRSVPVHLVGHDWGAVVAFKTASQYPELITLMVTMAIPYLTNVRWWQLLWHAPQQVWCSSYMLSMQLLPVYRVKFGDVLLPGYLDRLWAHWSPGWNFAGEIGSVRATLAQKGVLDHATEYYRCARRDLRHLRWEVDFERVPTLILGGVQDGCMVPGLFELEARLLASRVRVKVQLVEGVGHFLHREDPRTVAELVAAWLAKYSAQE